MPWADLYAESTVLQPVMKKAATAARTNGMIDLIFIRTYLFILQSSSLILL